MTTRHFYLNASAVLEEMTSYVRRIGWEANEKAEEGAVGQWTIIVADPALTLDFKGWRRWLIVEDASTATDHVIFAGHVADQEISRGEGDDFLPFGRVWTLAITDDNNRWARRVLRGTDCNRPAETDVARMQWLLGTDEVEWGTYLTDVTTYVSTANPVNMDKADYRGQMVNQVVDDCAQASGKNWWITTIYDGTGAYTDNANYAVAAWYGKDTA